MKITKEGKRFIIASVLIGVAAFNTGNNLIYLILSLMLSLILISLLVLKLNLSGLEIDVSIETPVFAGQVSRAQVVVRNKSRHVPAYSLNVLSEGLMERVYLGLITSASASSKDTYVRFDKRGFYSSGTYEVESGFPFILFRGRSSEVAEKKVLVYPALVEVGEILREGTGAKDGEVPAKVGMGEEIYSIRNFRHGDDWRRVHWKASAKASYLMVKEYAEYPVKKTTIILDNLSGRKKSVPVKNKPDMTASDDIFEKAVSLSGSLALYFIEQGHQVRVVSCRKTVPFGSGLEQLYKIMDILALIRQEDSWDSPLPEEEQGFTVSVLKARGDAASEQSISADIIVYADNI